MKVAHVIDSWQGLYGAEVMLLNLIEELREIKVSSVIVSLGSEEETEKPIEREAGRRGMDVCKVRFPRGIRPKGALDILKVCRKEKVNIIHSHGYKGDILLGLIPRRFRPIPVISTMHGWIAMRKFSKIWMIKYLNKLFLRRMDAVVKVNNVAWGLIDSFLFWNLKTFVVENGLQMIPKKHVQKNPTQLRIEEFCKNGFILGSIGRLSPEKGYLYLIEALESLLKIDRSYKLIIIGEGRSRKQLEERICKKGLSNHVFLPGYVGGASQYLGFFDAMILPSLTEGLPMTILEAMHVEVPIVATSVGGIPNVLGNGEYGVLVEPKSPYSLTKGILDIRIDPLRAKDRARRAKEVVVMKYSSKRMAEEYSKIYEMVLRQ